VPIAAGATPAWASMRAWSAAAAADPPGTTLLNAVPASCDVTTGNQSVPLSAIRLQPAHAPRSSRGRAQDDEPPGRIEIAEPA
jgi:hypothetical protein